MPEFEAVGAVRDFVETGGDVLVVIAFVTFVMWTLLIERFWYFRLVQPGRAEEALAIITQVIDVWKHLAKPEVQGDLRNINNKLWAEIDVFQDACKAVRTTKGEPAPEWSLTKLWEAFNE